MTTTARCLRGSDNRAVRTSSRCATLVAASSLKEPPNPSAPCTDGSRGSELKTSATRRRRNRDKCVLTRIRRM